MWREPYLETCCRSALHRLVLAGEAGRPPDLPDQPCLDRLATLGLVRTSPDGRSLVTHAGLVRHTTEIVQRGAPDTVPSAGA
jgi:hypothetical protein